MRHLVLLTALALAPAALAQIPTELVSPSPEASGAFGVAVAAVPGEGFLVGASGDAGNVGRAYLFGADGTLIHTLASANPENAGRFGDAVAAVPDADGDGRADLLVGAPRETVSGLDDAGRAYLFSSATGARIRTYEPPITNGNRQANGFYGRAVAGIEDVNGDGRGDVIIGAPGLIYEGGGGPAASTGRAFVVSGPNGALLAALEPIVFDPGGGGDTFGRNVAAVPDLDGDGLDDVAIAASGGAVGGVTLFSSATWEALRRVAPPAGSGGFGRSLAGASDLDGDGHGDLVVGSQNTNREGFIVGSAYVLSGATGAVLHTLLGPPPFADAAGFGVSVGIVATDDGTRNVLVGEPDPVEEVGLGGRVHLFDAASGTLLRTLLSPNSATPPSGQFGYAVAGLDGGKIAVGAQREFVGGVPAGRAYLYATTAASASLAGAEGWRLLAAPVGATAGALLDETYTQGVPGATSSDGGPSVFRYDESVAGDRDLGFTPLATMGERASGGRGLAVYVFEDDDPFTAGVQGGFPKTLAVGGLAFSGSPVAFPVSFTATAALQEDGWNLVGNPFDASLDWDVPGWVKTRVDNVVYVYDPVAAAYRTWNGSAGSLGAGLVAPFQGFWVKAHTANPALVAPPDARTEAAPPVDAITASVLAVEVSGTADGQAVADAAYVTFGEGADAGLDRLDAYELLPFRSTYAALYTEADGTALDVSALPPPDGSVEVPLGLALVADGAAASGTLTLRWPDLARLPASWALTLLDTEAGTETDLRAAPDYTFDVAASAGRVAPARLDGPPVPTPLRASSAEARTSGTRFVLRVAATAVADEGGPEAALALDAHPNPASGIATLTASLPEAGPARLALYDALGREVAVLLDVDVPAGRHEVVLDAGRLAPGVYVVRWQAGGAVVARTLTVVR